MKLLRAPVKPKWLPPAPVMGLSERRIPEGCGQWPARAWVS